MEKIKPIETEYNGYRFRSRLEARWAVFFDALNIKYEYEPEGFELQNGEKYLPDFYLPDLKYYAEVKGYNEHLIKDLEKVITFVDEAKTAVIILSNIPYKKNAKGLYWFPIAYYTARRCFRITTKFACFGESAMIEDWLSLGDIDWIGDMGLGEPYTTEETKEQFELIQAGTWDYQEALTPYKDRHDLSNVTNALLKARQARFEHGETPS